MRRRCCESSSGLLEIKRRGQGAPARASSPFLGSPGPRPFETRALLASLASRTPPSSPRTPVWSTASATAVSFALFLPHLLPLSLLGSPRLPLPGERYETHPRILVDPRARNFMDDKKKRDAARVKVVNNVRDRLRFEMRHVKCYDQDRLHLLLIIIKILRWYMSIKWSSRMECCLLSDLGSVMWIMKRIFRNTIYISFETKPSTW